MSCRLQVRLDLLYHKYIRLVSLSLLCLETGFPRSYKMVAVMG